MKASPPPAPATDRLILFDGVCNLCNGFIQFVIRHDQHNRFRFAALQSGTGQEQLRQAGLDATLSTIVFVQHGRAWTKSAAIIRIFAGLGYPWKLLLLTTVIPRPLRDALYTLVANNRYRLFGHADECWLMTPELARKFVG